VISPAVLLSLWLVAPPPRADVAPPSAAAPELRKLHVLVVLDTDSELRKQLEIDEVRLTRCLKERIPADRYALRVLKGADVTRDRILGACKDLKVGRNDGVLFFYGGPGGLGPQKTQLLRLHHGKPLLRSEIRRALEAKQAGLVVLLTDCCKRTVVDVGKPDVPMRDLATEINPSMRCLLFQARGFVDITSAEGGTSAGDTRRGSLFTRVLCKLLWQPIAELDRNKDGFVNWQEFYDRLKTETEEQFSNWSNHVRARGKSLNGTNARPRAFHLAQNPGNSTFAVVGVTNSTERTLAIRYRWYGEGTWSTIKVAPGQKQVFRTFVAGLATPLPTLEVQVDGISKVRSLKPALWNGAGEPSWQDSSRYRIGPKR
jgi:hypothetical protein